MTVRELPRRAWLGLEMRGLEVVGVANGSTAEDAGVRVGDRVLELNGSRLGGVGELAQAMRAVSREVELVVERAGVRVELRGTARPMPIEEVSGARVSLQAVETGRGRLRAIVTEPEAGRARGTVYVLPGGSWTSIEHPFEPQQPLRRLVQGLTDAGYATLRVERSGMGDSEGPSCTEVGFSAELAGYRAGLALAHGPVVLFGHSIGGVVAPLIARDGAVAAVVTYGAPAERWGDALLASSRREAERAGLSGEELERHVALLRDLLECVLRRGQSPDEAFAGAPGLLALPEPVRRWYAGDRMFGRVAGFHRELDAADAAGAWRELDRPVLALVGEHDWISSFGDARAIVDLVGHESSGAFEVAGADHHLRDRATGGFSQRLLDAMLAWLGTVLALAIFLGCSKRSTPSPAPAATSATTASARAVDMDEWRTLRTADGRERRYYVHAKGANPSRPLVLVLHGGGGNAEGAQTTSYTHAAADRFGAVAVYPEGVGERVLGKTLATWNGGYCCGKAKKENVDDVAFLTQLLDELAKSVPHDRDRVYATGISNGGMMAVRLACERPDRIAAISSIGSPGYVGGCKDPKPVAVQIIHGTADECALYAGGARCGGCWERAAKDFLGIPLPERSFPCTGVAEQAAFWRKVNGCSQSEKVTYERGSARCVEYAECTSKKPVSVCTITGGGHTWPGGERGCDERRRACRAFAEVTGPISRDLDANAQMNEFFARQTRTVASGSGQTQP